MPIRILKQFAHKNEKFMTDPFLTAEERAKAGFHGQRHRCEEVPLEITLEKRNRIGEMLQKKSGQIFKKIGTDFTTLRRVIE